MIRPQKVVEGIPGTGEFDQWEWLDGDLAPFLKHIRSDTAKTIAGQIAQNCEAWITTHDGQLNVDIFGGGDFIISFDVLQALAEGEIEFDRLDELKAFHTRVQAIADNLKNAIGMATAG